MDRVVKGNIRNGKKAIGNWGWDIKNVLTEQGSPPVDVFIVSLGVRRGSENLTWILIFFTELEHKFDLNSYLDFYFVFWEKGQILTWIFISFLGEGANLDLDFDHCSPLQNLLTGWSSWDIFKSSHLISDLWSFFDIFIKVDWDRRQNFA